MSELVTRRGAIALAGSFAGTLVLGGVGTAFAGPADALRPPGGQDEVALRALCVKCDRCRSVCPQGCVVPANVADGLVAARLPKLDFHRGACDFCEGELRCAASCPTGALGPFDPHADAIGVAVVDEEKCIAYVRGQCTVCQDSCDFDALVFDELGRPHIDEDACNGCGACVLACNVNVNRTYDGDNRRAIEVEAR